MGIQYAAYEKIRKIENKQKQKRQGESEREKDLSGGRGKRDH